MALVLVAAAYLLGLRERWRPHDWPDMGMWDGLVISLVYALIILMAWWVLRNGNGKKD